MPLARPIVHQTQPTPVCCTATCIAMALGTPVADLGVGLDSAYGLLDFGVYLAERGVWLRYLDRGDRFWSGSLYLLSVRSLNKIGTDHALLLDTRDCTCERPDGWCRDWKVYDRTKGARAKSSTATSGNITPSRRGQLKDRASSGAGIA